MKAEEAEEAKEAEEAGEVTRRMLPMFLTATMTHCTTCLRPLARLIALREGEHLNCLKSHKYYVF